LLLLLGALLAAERGLSPSRSPEAGGTFALAPPAARGARPAAPTAVGSATDAASAAAGQGAPLASSWRIVGSASALAVALLLRSGARPAVAATPLCGASPVVAAQSVEDPPTVMYTAGGRRKRLGVGGRVCMLTGAKKRVGYYRTFTEKKIKRYWRPNVGWKKIWWERENKWVRLFISKDIMREIDEKGIEEMARKAGLDLYAWCKPHWEPGSRQPLCLKVGYSPQSKRDKKFWPDYEPMLNKGAPLADTMPSTKPDKPIWLRLRKWNGKPKSEGTPPKHTPIVKRLQASKMVDTTSADNV